MQFWKWLMGHTIVAHNKMTYMGTLLRHFYLCCSHKDLDRFSEPNHPFHSENSRNFIKYWTKANPKHIQRCFLTEVPISICWLPCSLILEVGLFMWSKTSVFFLTSKTEHPWVFWFMSRYGKSWGGVLLKGEQAISCKHLSILSS